jgi:hypothetical protein
MGGRVTFPKLIIAPEKNWDFLKRNKNNFLPRIDAEKMM